MGKERDVLYRGGIDGCKTEMCVCVESERRREEQGSDKRK